MNSGARKKQGIRDSGGDDKGPLTRKGGRPKKQAQETSLAAYVTEAKNALGEKTLNRKILIALGELAVQRGLGVGKFSTMIGRSPRTVKTFFTQSDNPENATIERISHALGLSVLLAPLLCNVLTSDSKRISWFMIEEELNRRKGTLYDATQVEEVKAAILNLPEEAQCDLFKSFVFAYLGVEKSNPFDALIEKGRKYEIDLSVHLGDSKFERQRSAFVALQWMIAEMGPGVDAINVDALTSFFEGYPAWNWPGVPVVQDPILREKGRKEDTTVRFVLGDVRWFYWKSLKSNLLSHSRNLEEYADRQNARDLVQKLYEESEK